MSTVLTESCAQCDPTHAASNRKSDTEFNTVPITHTHKIYMTRTIRALRSAVLPTIAYRQQSGAAFGRKVHFKMSKPFALTLYRPVENRYRLVDIPVLDSIASSLIPFVFDRDREEIQQSTFIGRITNLDLYP